MRSLPVLAGAAALLALAACSSSGSQASSTSTTAGATSSAPTSSAAASSAEAVVSHYSATPTALGTTAPLKATPPRGKTFVALQCTLSDSCVAINAGVKAAVAALGWNYKVIPYDQTNPATLVAAMDQALQFKPVAVSLDGLPESLWESEVPKYKQAGVAIVPQLVGPVAVNSTVIASIGIEHGALTGKILANYFIAKSGGTGKALLVDVPIFGTLKSAADSFTDVVASGCPKCSVTTLNATSAEQSTNSITPAVVSELRRNPSIKYVVAVYGGLIPGLPGALQAAGVSGITIAGGDADVTNEQFVRDGTESAFTVYNYAYTGWLSVDAALRHLEGMPFPVDDGGIPVQLVTKATVGTPQETPPFPVGYQQQFEKLWKLG